MTWQTSTGVNFARLVSVGVKRAYRGHQRRQRRKLDPRLEEGHGALVVRLLLDLCNQGKWRWDVSWPVPGKKGVDIHWRPFVHNVPEYEALLNTDRAHRGGFEERMAAAGGVGAACDSRANDFGMRAGYLIQPRAP